MELKTRLWGNLAEVSFQNDSRFGVWFKEIKENKVVE